MFSLNNFAQVNFVPNWSFEDTVNCPTGGGQLYNALGWLNPTLGTPDYFNGCSSGIVTVPNNSGFQYAKTGNAYAGIFPYAFGSGREYVEIKLTDSLKQGQMYCISFYLSLANTAGLGINKFGAYFSSGLVSSGTSSALLYVPQFESSVTQFFLDTANWMKIEGTFIASGGENYITIGNFNSDSSTDTIQIISGALGTYYFIDDITLIECEAPVIPNVFTPNNDGMNDVFEIKNLLPNTTTQIYNRWGIKVFETNKQGEFWDGRTRSGNEAVAGTYFYIITAEEEIYKGFLQLIR